jgi:hypothetical protein
MKHSGAERFAHSISGATLAQTIATVAFLIGKLEELLALDDLPVIDGFTPRREVLRDALEKAHETIAALKRRAS